MNHAYKQAGDSALWTLIVVFVLLISVGIASASQLEFTEYNCSIDVPKGWSSLDLRSSKSIGPLQRLCRLETENEAKIVDLGVSSSPTGNVSLDLGSMVAGIKNGLKTHEMDITRETNIIVNGIPFHSLSFSSVPDGAKDR